MAWFKTYGFRAPPAHGPHSKIFPRLAAPDKSRLSHRACQACYWLADLHWVAAVTRWVAKRLSVLWVKRCNKQTSDSAHRVRSWSNSEECQKPQPPLVLKEVSQYTSNLYCRTPPLCVAVRIQFVLQCLWCPYALRKGKYCQYSSHL